MLSRDLDLLKPLLHTKERNLAWIMRHQDDYSLKKLTSSLNNVEMTQRDWIKAPWVNRNHNIDQLKRLE
jgi:hypothetical protein